MKSNEDERLALFYLIDAVCQGSVREGAPPQLNAFTEVIARHLTQIARLTRPR
jgi:hypothetical protein